MPNKYLWKDKTGRGFANTFTEKEIFELSENGALSDEYSWDGDSLKEWLDNGPEIGDQWENAANIITKTN